jgi:hypothetical protein
MAYTVIGVYDSYSDAESALNDLLSRKFPRHKMYLGLIEDSPLGREAALKKLEQSDGESTSPLTLPEFFRALFGDGQHEGDIYLEAVRRGSYVLMVNADDDAQADQAMDVMARHHPVNINERSARWRERGWSRFDPATEALTQDEVELEHSLVMEDRPSLPLQQVQGFPARDESAEPGSDLPILRNEAQRLGVRLYQRGF